MKTVRSRNIAKIEAVREITNDSMLFIFLEKDAILPSSLEEKDFNQISIIFDVDFSQLAGTWSRSV